MRKLNFTKMVASGNDFIVVDNRRKAVKHPCQFAKEVCRPHLGIGADGVLLLEKSRKADFKMRIVNADGSEAEACGNGFRCIARFARERLGFAKEFEFESLAGRIGVHVHGRRIRVDMVNPKAFKAEQSLKIFGQTLHYSFVNTGVPHVVIFVEGLSQIDVAGLGRALRHHKRFKPKGTNVNFVEVKGSHKIRVRTYERGVEAETLACGTGATASAIVSATAGYTNFPVEVITSGGEVLKIGFDVHGRHIRNVTLEGEAHFVYEGHLNGKV